MFTQPFFLHSIVSSSLKKSCAFFHLSKIWPSGNYIMFTMLPSHDDMKKVTKVQFFGRLLLGWELYFPSLLWSFQRENLFQRLIEMMIIVVLFSIFRSVCLPESQTLAGLLYFFDKFLILKGGEAPLKQSKWQNFIRCWRCIKLSRLGWNNEIELS